MKLYRQVSAISLLTFVLVACNQNPSSDTAPPDDPIVERPIPSWKFVGPADHFRVTYYGSISFALSTADVPYIAFWDRDKGGRASVMSWNGSSWQYVGQPGFSPDDYGSAMSLAVAGEKPYVAIERITDLKGSVMHWTGTAWEFVGKQGFTPQDPAWLSISISSHGAPYISFSSSESFNGECLASVMYYSPYSVNGWNHVGSPRLTVDSAKSISLTLSKGDDIPYIAFADGTRGGKISVLQKGLSTWGYLGTPGFSTGDAFYTSIQVSSTGTPYVAFKDYANGGRASVMSWNGSSWQYVGQPGFTGGGVSGIVFKLSNENIPYIAFKDYANDGKTSVMRWSSSGWEYVGKPGIYYVDEGYGVIHLAITSKGTPCIASRSGGSASVMCYGP